MLQIAVLTGLTALALCYFIWQWRSGAMTDHPIETPAQNATKHSPWSIPRPVSHGRNTPQRAPVLRSRADLRRLRNAA